MLALGTIMMLLLIAQPPLSAMAPQEGVLDRKWKFSKQAQGGSCYISELCQFHWLGSPST